MERLKLKDLRALLDFVRDGYALRDLDGFLSNMTKEIPNLLSCDTCTYNRFDIRRRRIDWVQHPRNYIQTRLGPEAREIADRCTRQHPIIAYHRRTRNGRAVKIADFLTRRQFHDLAVYAEFFRPIEVEHQLSVLLSASPRVLTGLCVSTNDRDFSERDRTILMLLRPHVVQAYRNAEAFTLVHRVAGHGDRGLVLLTPNGRIGELDSRGAVLLAQYFAPFERGRHLPDPLARWVRRQDQMVAAADGALPPLKPFESQLEGRRLVIHLFLGTAHRLLLLTEHKTPSDARSLEPLGLTRRQAEILAWVAQGKTNDEVATILGLSSRTVAKHLEMMYPRLSVENRTAAVARAFSVTQPEYRR